MTREEEAGKDEGPENPSESHLTPRVVWGGLRLSRGDRAQDATSTSGFNVCVILLPNLWV